MVRNPKYLFYIILIIWFLGNLIQACFTEILSDEAYYGLYGKYLAWGYFDHPPMVGVLTSLSSMVFDGNLGIRFMTVVLQVFTLFITWKIIDDKNSDSKRVLSFFIIAGSICMFSIYGFITTPDVGLLFFTSLFLWAYKKFLQIQSWRNVIVLAVSMAGLIYSKYHGALVIGFVVLSNLRLLRSYKFWISGIAALALLSPHIFWQITNDYPSLKYHLSDRSAGFKWRYLFEYIPNQLAVFNPFILIAACYTFVKVRPADVFTRSLYFLVAGFLCFFGLTVFRGHVEPHWTISGSIAIIILLYNVYNNGVTVNRFTLFLRKSILVTFFLLILGRILFMTDNFLVRKLGFAGKEEKYRLIESVARDKPVVFLGSFQGPSLYWFFTGKEGTSLSSFYLRRTQFDIWQIEKKYMNKPVFIYGNIDGWSTVYEKGSVKFSGFETDSLQTINRVGVEINAELEVLHPGDSIDLAVVLSNPYPYDIDFNHRKFPVTIYMVLVKGKESWFSPVILNDQIGVIHKDEKIKRDIKTVVPSLPGGRYSFGICLSTILGTAMNGSFRTVKIEAK